MFTTHEVTNQAQPWAGVNLFEHNLPMQAALAHFAPQLKTDDLVALGGQMGSAAWQEHARLANHHQPVLHTHDRFGQRIDAVEFHPSYHALMAAAAEFGLHAAPWVGAEHAHLRRAAGFMLFTENEPSVLCPISMTYAVMPALADNPALAAALGPQLFARAYDARFVPMAQKSALTMGMGLTEKQGGSDVRANTTQAVADGEDGWGQRFRITGHKWFFSAPMCDAFLVLAQTGAGLGCFFVPRWLPDGTRNAIAIQRLKDKLGNHANASSEVEFDGAQAWLVGDDGRGIKQILKMGMVTRLDCALGTAALMRQSLSIAMNHAHTRSAFGKKLIDQPLMRQVLADLALESEAATYMALRLAHAFDRWDDPHEAMIRRVLTPVAKFWICKRGAAFGQEAMECLGGNGYVEAQGEGVMARIYREMPLNSIWEGAGNIMALDLLRALRQGDVAQVLADEFAQVRGAHAALDAAIHHLQDDLDLLTEESQARRLAERLALIFQGALMVRLAPTAVADAFCRSRLAQAWGFNFGSLGPGLDIGAVIARAHPMG
jgi:putative acyl-CoA dehydrogenase